MELNGLLERMKLEHLAAQIDTVCEQAAIRDLDFKAFLAEALETEWRGRSRRAVETRLKLARFPWVAAYAATTCLRLSGLKVLPEGRHLTSLECALPGTLCH